MWRADIVNWNKISIETASLYLELAEKRLDETVETSKSISDKNDKLLTLTITLITAILSYILSTAFLTINEKYLSTTLILMLLNLIVQICFLFKNILPFRIGTKGEEPKFILVEKFIDKYDDKEQYLNLALHTCEMYQEKINCNQTINSKRNNRLMIAIYMYLGLPTFVLLVLAYRYLSEFLCFL